MSEQLDGLSMNIEETNKDKLKQVFPECFTEGKLDIDKLLSLCGEYMTDDFERYEFKWKGKSECLQLAQKRSTGTLRPCVEESVYWENTKNLYIEGDNLEVLKLLQRTYYHKVKMIYIDPPYNTGNDFVYEDDFKDPLERYREVTSQTTKSNPETMGRFHTNWLNMMYPRLRLAANLLREDGVCFISIDSHEVANLRKICDEVFGEENFVGEIANTNNPKGRSDDKYIATAHENLMVYAKSMANLNWFGFEPTEEIIKRYNKTEASGRKYREIDLRKTGENDLREDRPNLFYYFYYNEQTKKFFPDREEKLLENYIQIKPQREDGQEGNWRWGLETAQANIDTLVPKFMPSRKVWGIMEKDYLDKRSLIKPTTSWTFKDVNSERGTEEFINLNFDKRIFPKPKPIGTIVRCLKLSTRSNDIILDFFSGSATTAHAVMQLNAEDGGNRQFIMVQLPEVCDEKTEAYKAGYKNICEIGKERIRRAGRKILEEWEEKQKQLSLEEQKQSSLAEQGWEETQKQISLMEENQEEAQKQGSIAGQSEEEKPKEEQKPTPPDIGFRVFKLDTSNCKVWDNSPVPEDNLTPLEERLKNMTDRIKPGRTDLDMVFEIMLKLGIPLTDRVIPLDISGKRAYSIWENCLVLVCLEKDVTLKQLEEMADYAPARMVFAQDSFDGSVGKVNAEMTLQRYGIELKFL